MKLRDFHHSRFVIFLGLISGLYQLAVAQEKSDSSNIYQNSHRFKVYSVDGEMFMDGALKTVNIYATYPTRRQLRKGRKRLQKYTRIRWNVHKVYPYAVKVSNVLKNIEQDLNALPSEEARKSYLKNTEKSLFGKYEKDLRKMSRSQGRVLVKLVYRQTGNSTFHLIKDYKSGASAFFWQSIGLLFGINLKTIYDPEEDEMIEQIVAELENGGYNICYKRYNYSLN